MNKQGELIVGLGERTYPIIIESGCLRKTGEALRRLHIANRFCLIVDEKVASLYGETVRDSLSQAGLEVTYLTFPAGEQSKNLTLFATLCSQLAEAGIDRGDAIIALGGGVTGDLAGFVAASYMRGIPFVQIPTTLLAQVDSSVGGKTGVDIPEGKNLVGAFYQPRAVFIDTSVLHTLDKQEFLGGMAEVIKYGVIRDKDFFYYLRDNREAILNRDEEALRYVISTCCRIKAAVVAEDERESDVRRILNFGHTIGHAVEAVSGYSLIHGKAVAIGMVAAARLAVKKGLVSLETSELIRETLEQYGLPTEIPSGYSTDRIKPYLFTDKKSVKGKIAYILPRSIGEVVIASDVEDEIVDEVLR